MRGRGVSTIHGSQGDVGKGWARIGAIHEISNEASLDSFLKRFTHGTSIASYVAPLLELAEIAEIDRSRPREYD